MRAHFYWKPCTKRNQPRNQITMTVERIQKIKKLNFISVLNTKKKKFYIDTLMSSVEYNILNIKYHFMLGVSSELLIHVRNIKVELSDVILIFKTSKKKIIHNLKLICGLGTG